ncbi:MAG: hypothetical protein OXI26_06335 [bacterium]|nr:hypothetical protein [bacterium]
MRVRFERFALLIVALAHLAAQLAHGSSHLAADVPITAAQLAYVIVVVTVLPLLAVAVAFWKDQRSGARLFAAAMAASFVFGYLFHFVLDTADLHSNVVGEHSDQFFHSALSLALIEFAGLVYGLAVALRHGRSRSGWSGDSTASPGQDGGGTERS